MLTEKQIEENAHEYAVAFPDNYHTNKWAFGGGATWANEQNETELATLRAENAKLVEDKKNLNITIENAAEWSQKQADEIEKLSEALQRCKKWFFQHAPTAVLPDGTGHEAHREITDVLFRAEIPA